MGDIRGDRDVEEVPERFPSGGNSLPVVGRLQQCELPRIHVIERHFALRMYVRVSD